MINYYDILGVHRNAALPEIKAAFRKLAKQYHPDKNPNGKEYFGKVLLAYETLSRPHLKQSYDHRLAQFLSGNAAPEKKPAQGKNWKADEKELKRRQYYNEHIKKYAKATAAYNQKAESKKSYNEYKYILFATPLAVALFLLIMKFAGPPAPQPLASQGESNTSARSLQPGDSPYNTVFGDPVFDTIANNTLIVKNRSLADAIVCIFTKTRFVRCSFIPDNFSAELSRLPRGPFYLRYTSGNGFDPALKTDYPGAQGLFGNDLRFYKRNEPPLADTTRELVILPGLNEGYVITDAYGFFKTPTP